MKSGIVTAVAVEQNVTHSPENDTAPFSGVRIDVHALSILVFIGGVEVVIGVAGNCLLLTVLFTYRSLGMRTFHHLLIANLALCDLTTLGYWMTFFVLDLVLGYHPVLNEGHCRANGFLIATCLAASAFSLVSISLNRYLHVCHNHLYTRVFTKARTIICCVLIWTFSGIMALPPLFGVGHYEYSKAAHICSFRREDNSLYPKTMIIVFAVLSLSMVGYLNHAIFRHWKMTRVKLRTKYPFVPSNEKKRDPMLGMWQSSSENRGDAETEMTAHSVAEEEETVGPDHSESSTSAESEKLDESRFCEGDQSDSELQQGEDDRERERASGADPVCKRSSTQRALELARWRASSSARCAEDVVLNEQDLDNTTVPQVILPRDTQASSKGAENSDRVSQNLHRNSKRNMFEATEERKTSLEKVKFKTMDAETKSSQEARKQTETQLQALQRSQTERPTSQSQGLSNKVRRNLSQFLVANKKVLIPRGKRRQKQKASTLMRQIKRRRRKEHAKEVAFVRSLCVVFFLMLFCFLPFGIIMVVDAFHPLSPEVAMASNLVLFFHCSVNWMVYGLMNRNFRQGYVKQVKRVACTCSTLPCSVLFRRR